MLKKFILLSSAVFLVACGADTTDETMEEDQETTQTEGEDTETQTEPEEEAVDDPEAYDETGEVTYTTHQFANLIEDDNFEDANALQAWQDYQAVVGDASYGEATLLHPETSADANLEGSSPEEIDDLLSASTLHEELTTEREEVNETDVFHFYRYPAEEDGEEVDYIVELAFYYVENHLVFSSITPAPGQYELETDNLPTTEMLIPLETIPEMGSLEVEVLTVADMKINDNLIHQLMIPSVTEDEEPNEETMAFYYFVHGEEVIHYDILPFDLASDDFADQSLSLYEQYIPEIAEMDFDEAI